MKVRIVNKSQHPLPAYHTAHAAAFDLTANLEEPVELAPLERKLIPTGLFIAVPPGYEAQVRSRSGLAAKHGIAVLNSPGTIDADYRGEWQVILVNLSNESYEVQNGDRVAQVVIAATNRVEWDETKELDSTDRGAGGFGHTGV